MTAPHLLAPEGALAGRTTPMEIPARHFVLDAPLDLPVGPHAAEAVFGMGCFWGAERRFWTAPGVRVTAVGYAGGVTPNPTYREVCTGRTGHAEVVRVVYDPEQTAYDELLRLFWEGHDPTQGDRQGNDVGTQYRSLIIYADEDQAARARASLAAYQARLAQAGHGTITTQLLPASPFYFAEPDHQQYLAKNPAGYCGLGGTGVSCPIGLAGASGANAAG